MTLDREKLHEMIAAVCPIEGIRIGRVDDRASWGITAAPKATAEQMQAALDVLASYDPDEPAINDVRAECARRMMQRGASRRNWQCGCPSCMWMMALADTAI